MTINNKRIEEISLNAWPGLQQVLYDGWLLRLSKGYTKRANSVNPLYPSTLELEKKVAYCEEFYTARSLRPVFRLTPFSSPPDLDNFLEQRCYQVLDQTLVMVLDLETLDLQTHRDTDLLITNIDEWMEIFYQVSSASSAVHEVHKEILEAISTERYLVALKHAGAYAACGLGVLEAEYAGLFDIVTDPEARRRGYGTQIVLAILDWAREQGARYSYLQVVKGNFPARKMYEKIGFKELYRYWYRVPKAEISEKQQTEQETAEIFLELYNSNKGTNFSIERLGDTPDVVCKDSNTGMQLELEITLLESMPGEIRYMRGQGDKPRWPSTGNFAGDYINDTYEQLKARLENKLLSYYGPNTALILRQVNLLLTHGEWSAIANNIRKNIIRDKEMNFGAGIWIICTDNSKWPAGNDLFCLSNPIS